MIGGTLIPFGAPGHKPLADPGEPNINDHFLFSSVVIFLLFHDSQSTMKSPSSLLFLLLSLKSILPSSCHPTEAIVSEAGGQEIECRDLAAEGEVACREWAWHGEW
jgi:hypothetical protein